MTEALDATIEGLSRAELLAVAERQFRAFADQLTDEELGRLVASRPGFQGALDFVRSIDSEAQAIGRQH